PAREGARQRIAAAIEAPRALGDERVRDERVDPEGDARGRRPVEEALAGEDLLLALGVEVGRERVHREEVADPRQLVHVAVDGAGLAREVLLQALAVALAAGGDPDLGVGRLDDIEAVRVELVEFEIRKDTQMLEEAAQHALRAELARVVEAGVEGDLLAVEALEVAAEPVVLLADEDLLPRHGEEPRTDEAARARADDDRVGHAAQRSSWARTIAAFVPPKPKLFESTVRGRRASVSRVSSRPSQPSSGDSRLGVGAMKPSRIMASE